MEEAEERTRLDRVDGTCVRTCLVPAYTLKTWFRMFRGPERWKTSVVAEEDFQPIGLT